MTSTSSHLCGHPNKSRGRPPTCRRRVSGSDYCYQHRSAVAVDIPWQRTSAGPGRPGVPSARPACTAQAAATPQTYQAQNAQLRAILGNALHTRARKSGRGLCDELAALAASLEKSTAEVQELLTDVAARTASGARPSALARAVAGRFVGEVAAGPAAQAATVVRGIRLCGVVLCVVEPRDLKRCRCLTALAGSVRNSAAEDSVQRLLEHGLEPFLRGATAPV